MKLRDSLFNANWKINLLLLLSSFLIYFFYFHPIFLSINSILSSITLDSLKNYYTFVYHVKNDPDFLQFSGMNYPFSEHIVYSDCQPILTFVLRLFPFLHGHLIGIMHGLMFLSFIVSPLILNKILWKLGVDKYSSFFVSLAIALLAPQFLKINAGHFALAYGCVFPLSILFLLSFLKEKTIRHFLILFAFTTLLFFLHPYLGFCCSLLNLLTLSLYYVLTFEKRAFLKEGLFILGTGILPILIFKFFMLLTDKHINRTTEPYGVEMMLENIDSIMSPVFGPFKSFMELFFRNRTQHFEGHSYLGFFSILMSVALLISLPFLFRKIKLRRDLLVIFLASLFILFMSFGWHLAVLNLFHIQSASLNQFRAVCRFAWVFYYTLPLFVFAVIYHTLKTWVSPKLFVRTVFTISLVFFGLNLSEAHYFFKLDADSFWKYRNVFNGDQLNEEEKTVLSDIENKLPQAIIPLPLFHGGSEMYDRLGSSNSMLPAMIYSFHSRTPILSVMLSRTSISETEDLLQILNSYKKERAIVKKISAKDFFVIQTNDALMPDEMRLLKVVDFFGGNDSLRFGYISPAGLLKKKIDSQSFLLTYEKIQSADSNNVVFIPFENRKPFVTANINDYETIFTLDSNQLKSGHYIVSMHYHYKDKVFRSIASNLIITRTQGKDSEWQYNIPLRYLSGFYEGFGVFEYRVELLRENKYEFMLKGFFDVNYKISDFLLRPENKTTLEIRADRDTVFNNFPG